MLEQLSQLSRRKKLALDPGFSLKTVKWCVRFSDEGEVLALFELGDTSAKRNRGEEFKAPFLTQPEMKAGGLTKSHFIVEDCINAVLYQLPDPEGNDKESEKALAKHKWFINVLNEAASVAPQFKIAAKAFASPEVRGQIQAKLSEKKAKKNDKLTFRVGDFDPLRTDEWHEWWAKWREQFTKTSGKKQNMRCFVSGELAEPEKTHDKIKGLSDVGGQSSGTPLVSFNKDAFCSFGLKQSRNSAVSQRAAKEYTSALEYIVQHNSYKFGDYKVASWYDRDISDLPDPIAVFVDGADDTEEAQAMEWASDLLNSIRSGKRPELRKCRFYAISLSGSGGRVMVRDWMEGSFEELVTNVQQWFEDLKIHSLRRRTLTKDPKFFAVLGSTVRSLDDLNAPFVSRMWRAAIKGERIPDDVAAVALKRFRMAVITGDTIREAGIGLLKAFLIRDSKTQDEGGNPMKEVGKKLDMDYPSHAYQYGRLMAVLGELQLRVMPNVNASVVQRYFGAASTTPELVMGRLVRLSQHHIAKLTSQGAAKWFENQIAEISEKIPVGMEKTLDLREQTLFALGYYQQIASMRKLSGKKKDSTENDNSTENE